MSERRREDGWGGEVEVILNSNHIVNKTNYMYIHAVSKIVGAFSISRI
jgi:hypothetical protein